MDFAEGKAYLTISKDTMQLSKISKRLNISIDCIMGKEQKGEDKEMKKKANKLWVILLIMNVILTTIMVLVSCNQSDNILGEILIPAGPQYKRA